MAKYFGLLLLLMTLFTVGCSGPKAATEDQSSEGMDALESFDSPAELSDTATPDAEGATPDTEAK